MTEIKFPTFYIPLNIIPNMTNILMAEGLKVEENVPFSSELFICETIHKYSIICLSPERGAVKIEFGWNKYFPEGIVKIIFMGHPDENYRGDKDSQIKLYNDVVNILRRHGLADIPMDESKKAKISPTKVLVNLLLVIGVLYLILFGLNSKSNNAIIHCIISGILILPGIIIGCLTYIKERKIKNQN